MSTPLTNAKSWYGRYVRKDSPVVSSAEMRALEEAYNDLLHRERFIEGEIISAHRVLDDAGVPRNQENGLPYSLVGRLRIMRIER